ncbi:MAG: Hsp20/alpha crystallin family protein [Pirellulaceae bacterium]|nr:Hsp20/alpha crystallin family protein [Pirellulaceae bacterium]
MNQNIPNRSLTPIEEFSTDLERMFDSLLGRTVGSVLRAGQGEKFTPQLDIVETANDYVVSVDLPGVKPDDVKLEIEDGKLSISGKREAITEENTKNVHRVERTKGSFYRLVALPREVDTQKVDAHYEHGVLKVTLPKSAEKQPRKIEIRATT